MSYNCYISKPYLWVLIFFLFQYLTFAQANLSIRVIDESAISYMEFLPKKEFDQRFPGQIKSNPAALESGWYVIYTHENLNYYFGPILLESTGQDYLMQLTQIVDAAVEQRPEIQGYELLLNYEPSADSFGDSGNSGRLGDDKEGSNGRVNEQQSDETSQPSSGFWGFILRIFGRH